MSNYSVSISCLVVSSFILRCISGAPILKIVQSKHTEHSQGQVNDVSNELTFNLLQNDNTQQNSPPYVTSVGRELSKKPYLVNSSEGSIHEDEDDFDFSGSGDEHQMELSLSRTTLPSKSDDGDFIFDLTDEVERLRLSGLSDDSTERHRWEQRRGFEFPFTGTDDTSTSYDFQFPFIDGTQTESDAQRSNAVTTVRLLMFPFTQRPTLDDADFQLIKTMELH